LLVTKEIEMLSLLKAWLNWCLGGCGNSVSISQSGNGKSTNVVQVGNDIWINGVEIKINEPVRSIKTINGVTWVNGKRVQ